MNQPERVPESRLSVVVQRHGWTSKGEGGIISSQGSGIRVG